MSLSDQIDISHHSLVLNNLLDQLAYESQKIVYLFQTITKDSEKNAGNHENPLQVGVRRKLLEDWGGVRALCRTLERILTTQPTTSSSNEQQEIDMYVKEMTQIIEQIATGVGETRSHELNIPFFVLKLLSSVKLMVKTHCDKLVDRVDADGTENSAAIANSANVQISNNIVLQDVPGSLKKTDTLYVQRLQAEIELSFIQTQIDIKESLQPPNPRISIPKSALDQSDMVQMTLEKIIDNGDDQEMNINAKKTVTKKDHRQSMKLGTPVGKSTGFSVVAAAKLFDKKNAEIAASTKYKKPAPRKILSTETSPQNSKTTLLSSEFSNLNSVTSPQLSSSSNVAFTPESGASSLNMTSMETPANSFVNTLSPESSSRTQNTNSIVSTIFSNGSADSKNSASTMSPESSASTLPKTYTPKSSDDLRIMKTSANSFATTISPENSTSQKNKLLTTSLSSVLSPECLQSSKILDSPDNFFNAYLSPENHIINQKPDISVKIAKSPSTIKKKEISINVHGSPSEIAPFQLETSVADMFSEKNEKKKKTYSFECVKKETSIVDKTDSKSVFQNISNLQNLDKKDENLIIEVKKSTAKHPIDQLTDILSSLEKDYKKRENIREEIPPISKPQGQSASSILMQMIEGSLRELELEKEINQLQVPQGKNFKAQSLSRPVSVDDLRERLEHEHAKSQYLLQNADSDDIKNLTSSKSTDALEATFFRPQHKDSDFENFPSSEFKSFTPERSQYSSNQPPVGKNFEIHSSLTTAASFPELNIPKKYQPMEPTATSTHSLNDPGNTEAQLFTANTIFKPLQLTTSNVTGTFQIPEGANLKKIQVSRQRGAMSNDNLTQANRGVVNDIHNWRTRKRASTLTDTSPKHSQLRPTAVSNRTPISSKNLIERFGRAASSDMLVSVNEGKGEKKYQSNLSSQSLDNVLKKSTSETIVRSKSLVQAEMNGLDMLQTPLVETTFIQITLSPLNNSFDPMTFQLSQTNRFGRHNLEKYPAFHMFTSRVVSKHHCELFELNGKVYLKDIGSHSGTFVNGSRLSPSGKPSEPVELHSGDFIQLGKDHVETKNSDPQATIEAAYKCVKMQIIFTLKQPPRIPELEKSIFTRASETTTTYMTEHHTPEPTHHSSNDHYRKPNTSSEHQTPGSDAYLRQLDEQKRIEQQLSEHHERLSRQLRECGMTSEPIGVRKERTLIPILPHQIGVMSPCLPVARTHFTIIVLGSSAKIKKIQVASELGTEVMNINLKHWDSKKRIHIQDLRTPVSGVQEIEIKPQEIEPIARRLVDSPEEKFIVSVNNCPVATIGYINPTKLQVNIVPEQGAALSAAQIAQGSPSFTLSGDFKENKYFIIMKFPNSREQRFFGEATGRALIRRNVRENKWMYNAVLENGEFSQLLLTAVVFAAVNVTL